jgi:hypothetical protein
VRLRCTRSSAGSKDMKLGFAMVVQTTGPPLPPAASLITAAVAEAPILKLSPNAPLTNGARELRCSLTAVMALPYRCYQARSARYRDFALGKTTGVGCRLA